MRAALPPPSCSAPQRCRSAPLSSIARRARSRPAHRAALTSERAERTGFTNLYSGGLARGLPTRLTEDLGRVRAEAPPFPLATEALLPLRAAEGFMPMWAGQAARLGEKMPARALTEKLGREALALLRSSA